MSRKRLTPKDEDRVVILRAEGHTLAEIAQRFGCSRATVWNVLQARAASLPGSSVKIEVPG